MKPEKFIGIMLITMLLSCEMDEQVEQKVGEVIFESNQHIVNSVFDIHIYIDGNKVGSLGDNEDNKSLPNDSFSKKLLTGVHHYEAKIYSFNGEASKKLSGTFIVHENKQSEIFIDFKEYNSWN